MELDYIARCPKCRRMLGLHSSRSKYPGRLASLVSEWIIGGLSVERMSTINAIAEPWGHADDCPCGVCKQSRAVLRYVPAGDASDPGVASEWVAAFPHKARRLAHALHAAADAAEETAR